jgi:hypothetical protein
MKIYRGDDGAFKHVWAKAPLISPINEARQKNKPFKFQIFQIGNNRP